MQVQIAQCTFHVKNKECFEIFKLFVLQHIVLQKTLFASKRLQQCKFTPENVRAFITLSIVTTTHNTSDYSVLCISFGLMNNAYICIKTLHRSSEAIEITTVLFLFRLCAELCICHIT